MTTATSAVLNMYLHKISHKLSGAHEQTCTDMTQTCDFIFDTYIFEEILVHNGSVSLLRFAGEGKVAKLDPCRTSHKKVNIASVLDKPCWCTGKDRKTGYYF